MWGAQGLLNSMEHVLQDAEALNEMAIPSSRQGTDSQRKAPIRAHHLHTTQLQHRHNVQGEYCPETCHGQAVDTKGHIELDAGRMKQCGR